MDTFPSVSMRVLPARSQIHSQDEVTVLTVLIFKATLYDKN